MEQEFLELIKTFDKTMKRLEVLDSKILSFKDVLEGLRENLDELVELVKLEGIIELATEGTEKISTFNQQYDTLISTYHRLLQIEDIQEQNDQRWAKMEAKLEESQRLSEQVLELLKRVNRKQNGTLNQTAIQLCDGCYVLNHEGHVCWYSTETKQTTIIAPASQMRFSNGIVFACNQTEILMIQHQEIQSRIKIKCHQFEILGYQLYYLSETELGVYHLLTQQHQLIETDVKHFSLVNDGILIEKTDEISVIKL